MSSVVPQLKVLINLAGIDGAVAYKEKQFITNIGLANGMKQEEISPLFLSHHETIVPDDLTADQKFNFLINLVQLMKIDERLYRDEIKFCSDIAARLGYDPNVMFDLMLNVRSTSAMNSNEIGEMKKLVAQHLKKT